MKIDLYRDIIRAGRKLIKEQVANMTDTEKALLTECPYCGEDYQFGCSEVDADENCRVTCGGCGRHIEYRIEWVDHVLEWEERMHGPMGEKIWQKLNLGITRTYSGAYRLWDDEQVDTVGIFDTLRQAKLAGDNYLKLNYGGVG